MIKTLDQALASSAPIWLLDVDGVINSFPSPTFDQLMASQDWADVLVNRYKIWYRRSVVEFINDVHRVGLAQPVWLTTWADAAVVDLAPALGLATLPAIVDLSGDYGPTDAWWKLARFEECVRENPDRALVWTDDQLRPDLLEQAQLVAPDALLLAPRSNPGLEPHHLELIRAYLEARC